MTIYTVRQQKIINIFLIIYVAILALHMRYMCSQVSKIRHGGVNPFFT